jgi:hypothetical protein
MGKGKNALHRLAELVERIFLRLRAPLGVSRNRAQIVHLHNDCVPIRANEIRRVWVLGWGYTEAAPAGVTEARGGTE